MFGYYLLPSLEQIGAEYVDKENSESLANPYTYLEPEERKDWEADYNCFYCQGELTNVLDLIDDLLQAVRSGKVDADNTYVRSLQELLPFYIKFYTQGLGRDLLAEVTSRSTCSTSMGPPPTAASTFSSSHLENDDQEHLTPSSQRVHVELKIPHILQSGRGRKSEMTQAGGTKRYYPEDDGLEVAVTDARRMKLDDHRASALYGISQSALCNNIFSNICDPDHDRMLAFVDQDDSNSGDEPVAPGIINNMKMSGLIKAGTFSYLPPVPFHQDAMKEELDFNLSSTAFDDFSVKLAHIRRMHNLSKDRDIQIKPAHINEPKLPLLTTLIRKLVEQRFQMEVGCRQTSDKLSASSDSSQQKNNISKSEERKSTAILVDTLPHFIPYLSSFSPSCLSTNVPFSTDDLRVPSYKPTNTRQPQQANQDVSISVEEPSVKPFGHVYETGCIGEVLKDIIAKTISEKISCRDSHSVPSFPSAAELFSQASSAAFPLDMGKSAFQVCHADVYLSQPSHPAKRIKREPLDDHDLTPQTTKSSCNNKTSTSAGPDSSSKTTSSIHNLSSSKSSGEGGSKEKKARPKRGQYRKYNSQLLIEAVRAVQRGEMSVHRAGSYFGVPHSTLEYKVKERHLLRQKKPREPSTLANTSTTSTTTTSTTTSALVPTAPSRSACAGSPILAGSSAPAKPSLTTSGSSSDSSASSFSSQQHLGNSKDSPLTSSSPVSALGFGLHKQAASEFPWFQPYLVSGPVPSPFDPTISLFPQGFTLNTSASELLRKLQHKVQSKSAVSSPFSSDSSFAFPHPNGSSSLREGFLLFN
ncbi:hypothetical protein C0Q70_10064 [Pomacea canaliculata]|uniref:HTH psq-type domain-containing protein n=1 Tax=Pomacea canaliculata TaxID=400727 RepID=A0A2T7PBK2_POMCA|nr:hypothetical protein C0Q70_10064 [Pomacea canaliculata]